MKFLAYSSLVVVVASQITIPPSGLDQISSDYPKYLSVLNGLVSSLSDKNPSQFNSFTSAFGKATLPETFDGAAISSYFNAIPPGSFLDNIIRNAIGSEGSNPTGTTEDDNSPTNTGSAAKPTETTLSGTQTNTSDSSESDTTNENITTDSSDSTTTDTESLQKNITDTSNSKKINITASLSIVLACISIIFA
ncbi:hypothetical protein BB558_001307 [Smittium angustum]|uniref:FAS1 domain-containing protein n=1 Tax=Smittium angustum TaxID=133377 RepID=A0A2U1JBL5_SMIAN|nr:hypothetical protein BB558_001307 [Smittium angustum]